MSSSTTNSITDSSNIIYVMNRRGVLEPVDEERILLRLQKLCSREPMLTHAVPTEVVKHVVARLHSGVSTRALDALAARHCATRSTTHPHFERLGARIVVSDLHKSTNPSYAATTEVLALGKAMGNISKRYLNFVRANAAALDRMIESDEDYNYTYFGLQTLFRSYLLRVKGVIVETPQYMLMRVAVCLYASECPTDGDALEKVRGAYEAMSKRLFTHATPTLFNAGGQKCQLLSCFLIGVHDSIHGIYKAVADCAAISKHAGGIGLHIWGVRGNNSLIRSINGRSSGVTPMCRVFESTALHVNQAGRRNGSFAMYMTAFHVDVTTFLKLKRHQGEEEQRARNLHYAMWLSDAFMRAVQTNGDWHLLCPDECPRVAATHGTDAFEEAYKTAIAAGKSRRVVKARFVWMEIIKTQIETGEPYILFADAANRKSNQQNLGTIRSSNLCAEIIEYSDHKEYACCTLASVALPAFVRPSPNRAVLLKRGPLRLVRCRGKVCLAEGLLRLHDMPFVLVPAASYGNQYGVVFGSDDVRIGSHKMIGNLLRPVYDYVALKSAVEQVVQNLDHAIDRNYYPVPETKVSNMRHRPLGIGVQGLADVLNMMRHPYDSAEGNVVNTRIAATIYYAAMGESVRIAESKGAYDSFVGSPLSRGMFQFDLWGVEPLASVPGIAFDWGSLRKRVMEKGARHSLLTAYMPTASTSSILGNNECFEAFTTNIYSRETSAGSFVCVNKHMVRFLQALDLWGAEMKDRIIANRGSVVGISDIPSSVQSIFKTSWDLSQKSLIDQSASRGPYICQSQSLNLYFERPKVNTLSSAYFHCWKSGLKTCIYYLHSRAPASAQAVTIAPKQLKTITCESCQG